jgi:predicted RNA-binding protein YlxR (DUF448 family)
MKTAVNVVRQIIGKGKTEHSGRGFYIMESENSVSEVIKRVKAYVKSHPEAVEEFREDDNGAVVVKLIAADNDHYRKLVVWEDCHFPITVIMI